MAFPRKFKKTMQILKKLWLILIFICTSGAASAQWIGTITTNPQQPTEADTIIIIFENSFPSGPCEGAAFVSGIQGSGIDVVAAHCVGMLTVVCTDYDTIKFAPGSLTPGVYFLNYTLMTGSGSELHAVSAVFRR
jgi:hypothetical protein